MWQGINLEICWILISQWKSTRNGPGCELCKIVLCTRECSGPVLREGKVNVWLWRQIAEESKTLRALERQAGRCTPLGRKRFFHKHQLPSSPLYSHKKGKPGSAALSFLFLSLLHSRSIWAASLHPYGSGMQRRWHSTAQHSLRCDCAEIMGTGFFSVATSSYQPSWSFVCYTAISTVHCFPYEKEYLFWETENY